MRQSTRLIVNTISTLAKMLVTFVIGIVVVRLLVQQLGLVDYGLLGLLGGTAALVNLVAGVLTRSCQRHFAFEIGRDDRDRLQVLFNTSLVLYLVLGLVLFMIGLVLAPLLLSVFQIPAGRAAAARWVFYIVLVRYAVNTGLVPFRALMTAQQDMYLLDGIEVLSTVLNLFAALSLLVVPWDKLVTYAALSLAVGLVLPLATCVVCLVRFPVSRPAPAHFSAAAIPPLVSFAGWISVQHLGLQLRLQGGLMLINVCFGVAATASYQLALEVARHRQRFARAIMRPVGPAMTGMVARGDWKSLRRLIHAANKYCTLSTFYVVVPVVLEVPEVFRLWLGRSDIPAEVPTLVRLILAWMSIKVLTRGYAAAMAALGDLARFATTLTTLTFSTLALAAFWFYAFDAGPWALPATAVGMNVIIDLFVVGFVGRRVQSSYGAWLGKSLGPVLIVLAAAGLPAWGIRLLLPAGWPRLLAVTFTYGVLATALTWTVAMEPWEKRHLRRVFSSGLARARAAAGPIRPRSS